MTTTRDGRAEHPAGSVLLRPLRDFLHTEAAGGVVLLVATFAALVWANSPWWESYNDFWHTRLAVELGERVIELDLREWINDGLMTIFFFVVGLEIKRELVEGELREPRRAAMPAIAAVGGMVVPGLIYAALNAGGAGADGWGIPVATDIAMAVGVLSLLGSRVAPSLKLFLLALAIVDDIGAIGIIAVFYSEDLDVVTLAVAAGLVAAVAFARAWLHVRPVLVYVALGAGLWLALEESGVHATLAGVILGLMAPTRPVRRAELIDADELADVSSVEAAHRTVVLARQSVSVVEWLEHVLHPWTSFAIVPLFALANAGLHVTSEALSDAASSTVTYGVVVGLVVGKLAGVTAFTWLAIRLRHRRLAGRRHVDWDLRRRCPRRDRLHGVDLRHRTGLRRPRAAGRSEDRHPRRVDDRGDRRIADPGAEPTQSPGPPPGRAKLRA